MTLLEFSGCALIAFGPPLALFIFTIAHDPLRVIILMASAFFWLLSLLLSSILWFAVVPLRNHLSFGMVFSVLFQELFRFIIYILLSKAEAGLKKVSIHQGNAGRSLVENKHLMAYVAGLGFGVISGAFAMVNVLADSSGPGTVGIYGDSSWFFLTSALTTLCFIFLHIFWGILFFNGLNQKSYIEVGAVISSHLLLSCLTILNQSQNPAYWGSILPAYLIMIAFGVWSFITVGGNVKGLKSFFSLNSQYTCTIIN